MFEQFTQFPSIDKLKRIALEEKNKQKNQNHQVVFSATLNIVQLVSVKLLDLIRVFVCLQYYFGF